jgi:hypothetical protein
LSKLRNFIRDVNRECDLLPIGCHPRRIRMNRDMFERLRHEATLEGIDITRSEWGADLPDGYDGMIASLPIVVDNWVVNGAVDIDFEHTTYD